ncbi:MAG TPA: CBS domain-containing protein [Steroidobacteraceae bacterium]|nr:CBS domain-containing protein [Steroidobacteraceae bacterium]
MNVGQVCGRHVVTVLPGSELVAAAGLMREKHIGYLVVVESEWMRRPVGVLTDRDIVVSVVAKNVDPASLTVGDVMTSRVVATDEQGPLDAALVQMRRNGVRRLPVLGPEGEVVGVLSIDDALQAIMHELDNAAGSIRLEREVERATRD